MKPRIIHSFQFRELELIECTPADTFIDCTFYDCEFVGFESLFLKCVFRYKRPLYAWPRGAEFCGCTFEGDAPPFPPFEFKSSPDSPW